MMLALTGSMRRPPKVMRPKCGQTRTPTKPIRRSQDAELGTVTLEAGGADTDTERAIPGPCG